MDTPKLTEFSFQFAETPADKVTVLVGVSRENLTAWLAQEVKCPCQNVGYMLLMPTLNIAYGITPRCDMCHGDTHLTLSALIQKLEADG